MADYSLGTAHGRIVIDYDDSGSKRAQADFEITGQRAQSLVSRLRALASSITSFGFSAARNIDSTARSIGLLTGGVTILGALAGATTRLGQSFGMLRGASSILGALGFSLFGLGNATAGFPRIIRQIVLLSSAIGLLRATTGVISTIINRFTGMSRAAGAVRGLGEAVSRLGRPVRAIAGLAVAIGGLARGIGIATSLAKAFGILGSAIAAIGGAAFVIGGLIQALIQLAGVLGTIPGLAFAAAAAIAALAVGMNGLKAGFQALNTPPPGIANAGRAAQASARRIRDAQQGVQRANQDATRSSQQAARASQDSSRAIADAQRGVEDAYRNAARAARDAADAVVDAQKALSRAVRQAARDAEASARRIEDAQRALARTVEDSARSVVSAQRRVVDAQRAQIQAQKDLNRLQQEAIDLVEELNERSTDLVLDREDAEIALQEALLEQERVNHDLISTDLDRRKAANAVAKAQDRLSDVQKDQTDTTHDLADAQEAVISGNDAIIDARQRLIDATEELAQAEQDLVTAQRDAAQAVIDAQRDVADAYKEQAEQQIASQEAIADAQDAVSDALRNQREVAEDNARAIADAQRAVGDAAQQSADMGIGAADGLADANQNLADALEDAALAAEDAQAAYTDHMKAFNELAPAAQEFLLALKSLEGRWKALRNAVQQRLFEGLAKEVLDLADIYFPVLEKGLGNIATQFNRGAKEFASWLKQPETVRELGYQFSLVEGIMSNLIPAIKPLATAFSDIATVGLEALLDLSGGAEATSQKFADFIARVKADGSLRSWIDRGIQGVKDLFNIVGNLYNIFQALWRGLVGPEGQGFLAWLSQATTQLRAFLESARGQEILRQLGEFIGNTLNRVLTVLTEIFNALWPAVKAALPYFEQLAQALTTGLIVALKIVGPLLEGATSLLSLLAPVTTPILGALFGLGVALKGVGLALGIVKLAIAPLIWALQALGLAGNILRIGLPLLRIAIMGVTTAFRAMSLALLANPFVALAAAVVAIALLIYFHWDSIKAFFTGLWNAIVTEITTRWNQIKTFFTQTIPNIVRTVIDGFIRIGTDIGNKCREILDNVGRFFGQAIPDAVRRGLDVVFQTVSRIFGQTIPDAVRRGLDAAFQAISTWATQTVPDAVRRGIDALLQAISTFFTQTLPDTVRRGIDTVLQTITRWATQDIPNAVRRGISLMISAGGELISGILQGLQRGAQAVFNFIYDLCRQVWDYIKNFFGIASPAKLTKEGGKDIGLGLAEGIKDSIRDVVRSAKQMVQKTDDTLSSVSDIRPMVIEFKEVISKFNLPDIAQILFDNLPSEVQQAATEISKILDAIGNREISVRATVVDALSNIPTTSLATTAGTTAETGPAPINVDNLHLHIAGNLDPTNPVLFRKSIIMIRDEIRGVEKSRKQ